MIQKMIASMRNDDELPTAAKLRDHVGRAIRHRQTRFFFFVRVARNTRAQQFVSAPQTISQRTQHFQRHVRFRSDKREKRIARQNREARVFDHLRVSGTLPPVDDRHLAKKISLGQLREGQFLLVVVANTDPHPPAFNQVHRVAGVALAETGACSAALFFRKAGCADLSPRRRRVKRRAAPSEAIQASSGWAVGHDILHCSALL